MNRPPWLLPLAHSDFYFGKLREIEILCQADDWKDLSQIQEILEILYQTEVGPFPAVLAEFRLVGGALNAPFLLTARDVGWLCVRQDGFEAPEEGEAEELNEF